MKTIFNLIILTAIGGGGYYFYEQNKGDLNQTLDDVKNMSVESVTDSVIENVKNIDTDELMQYAMDNKEKIAELMDEHDISLDNIDMEKLKSQFDDSGISFDNINLDDAEIQKKLKSMIEAAKK